MKHLLKTFLTTFIALLCLFGVAKASDADANADAPTPKEGWPSHLRVLSGPMGGQWFMFGEALSKIYTQSLLPTTNKIGGGVINIAKINDKDTDLGFTLYCFLASAGLGLDEYKDVKVDNVAILANAYPQVLYFLVRKDFAEENKITNVGELLQLKKPVRFASLRKGTSSEFMLRLLLRYCYNTNPDDLRQKGWSILYSNYAEISDNFATGKLDCFIYTAGTNVPLIKDLENYTQLTFIPLEDKSRKIMIEKLGMKEYAIPAGQYKGIDAPSKTVSDYTTILVRKDLPNDLVYEMCRMLWEQRDSVKESIDDFKTLTPKTAIAKNFMHPGALKFWQDQEGQELEK